jgi:hypothetical protein
MDAQQRKTALRAITYGLYVLTARDWDQFAAAGVSVRNADAVPLNLRATGMNYGG